MERAPTDRLLVQRNVILGLLLGVASAAWVLPAAATDAEVADALHETQNPELTDHDWYQDAAKRLGLIVQ
jgi:hypothetical protein